MHICTTVLSLPIIHGEYHTSFRNLHSHHHPVDGSSHTGNPLFELVSSHPIALVFSAVASSHYSQIPISVLACSLPTFHPVLSTLR